MIDAGYEICGVQVLVSSGRRSTSNQKIESSCKYSVRILRRHLHISSISSTGADRVSTLCFPLVTLVAWDFSACVETRCVVVVVAHVPLVACRLILLKAHLLASDLDEVGHTTCNSLLTFI